jgi:glycosyltransferase involved in cell wall biosynthesis
VRLLLLNKYYPPDVAPTGRYLHDLARVLAGRGHEVHVVCSRRGYGGRERFPAEEERDGVRVHRVAATGFGRRYEAGRAADYTSFVALLLWRALRLPRPDLILSLTSPPYLGVATKFLARLRRTHHAHWIMDLYPDAAIAHGLVAPTGVLARRLESLARWQLRGARVVLALGPFSAGRVTRLVEPGRIQAIPLWADPTLFAAGDGGSARAARGWAEDELVLMYSGNMGLGHRFDEFLEAARRLGPAGPRWAFIGGGARKQEIKAFARAHPEARLELHHYAPAEELAESLASADVQLASLRSGWEGVIVPSKVQAILAVGRPVIFVGPGQNEAARWIQEAGAGWIVGEGDVEGLLAAIDAARDPGKRERRSCAARAFARSHFTRDSACDRIAALLEPPPPS